MLAACTLALPVILTAASPEPAPGLTLLPTR
jgi:hypothetical protein